MTVPGPVDPGAIPTTARALAPDLARGGMLLLIALANVHLWAYGHPVGVRAYPSDLAGADRWVTLVQMLLVDGRAYPLFAFLFGYGIVQLARRRTTLGVPVDTVLGIVRRRGAWMLLIGFCHGLLLWSGDIVGCYGLLALLLGGTLLRGSDRRLLVTAGAGLSLVTLIYAFATVAPPPGQDTRALLPSMATANPFEAALLRLAEWLAVGLTAQAIGVFGAVCLGALAARRSLLDDPARHRVLLVRVAVGGLGATVLLGLPSALAAAQMWAVPTGPLMLAGMAHAFGGYAGGLGYAALFGLLALRLARGTGVVSGALQACGQRSLSCYIAQSVAFAALLPAWTAGLGDGAHLWQVALYGFGTWLVILVLAAVAARADHRGPAEILLRRLTYGPRPPGVSRAGR